MKMSTATMILLKTILLLGFIAVRANPTETTEELKCPIGWVKVHRGCYMIVTEELAWNDALIHCQENSGELTIIQSEREKEELEKYLETNNLGPEKLWVGLTRNSTSGEDWRWLGNLPLDSKALPWSNPSFKTRRGQMCGYVDMPSKKLQTGSTRCDAKQSFICEYHSITARPQTDSTSTMISGEIFASSSTLDTTISTRTPAYTNAIETKNQLGVQTTHVSNEEILSTTIAQSTTTPKTSSLVASVTEQTSTTESPVTIDNKKEATSGTTMTAGNNDVTTPQLTNAVSTTTESSSTTTTTTATTTTSALRTTTQRPTSTSTSSTTSTTTTRTTRIRTSTPRSTTTTTPYTTHPPIPDTPRPTMVDWAKALDEFHGCYIPGTGGSLRDTVLNARRFYLDSRTTCPEVQIGNILWSEVEAGETAKSSCSRGVGFATFHCGDERICWTGQPDVNGCASQALQKLLKKVEDPDPDITAPPPTIEESIQLSSQLAKATENEETNMEDVLVTSQVITALTHVTEEGPVKSKEQVQAIVDNVVKAGSNLVSSNKSAMWEEMSQDDKVRSASTLLVAMETATVSMAQEINEPAVLTQRNENLELELRVVDMSALEKEKVKEIVYDSSQSDSSFSIPMETLQSVSKGGLAKAVFMTHYSMSDILGGRSRKHSTRPVAKPRYDNSSTSGVTTNQTENRVKNELAVEDPDKEEVEEETGPRIASYILSASLGVDGHITKLPKPITFTMRHVEEIEAKYVPLCSFWNVSKNMHQGFWSQEGCRVLRTNRSHTTCECDHLTNFAILLDVHGFEAPTLHKSLLRLVTIIGCIISCISLMASWITFQCFTSLQGERNSIHKNLAMTLLLAEILFVFGIDQARNQILCSVIAGFLHFLFLAAFMWMFIEGLHIIFMLVQVFDASRSRLPYYYLTGYGVPFIIIGVSCLFFYRGYGTDKFCWLTTERYFVWAFAGPVAIILLVNAIFLTYAMSTVCRHSEYVFSGKDKATGSGMRAWVQGALALEVLLGLTWTLGYFLINDDSLPLAYVFSILNSLQGLFIFFFHCLLNKKAQKEYRQMARSVVKRSPSSGATHSTLTKRTNHTNHSHDINHSPSNSHQKLNIHNGHSLA